MHDRLTLRGGHHARAEADQPARGDREFQVHLPGAIVHPHQFPAAIADQLHHAAHVLLGHVDDEVLDRLGDLAGLLVLFHDHVRLAD